MKMYGGENRLPKSTGELIWLLQHPSNAEHFLSCLLPKRHNQPVRENLHAIADLSDNNPPSRHLWRVLVRVRSNPTQAKASGDTHT